MATAVMPATRLMTSGSEHGANNRGRQSVTSTVPMTVAGRLHPGVFPVVPLGVTAILWIRFLLCIRHDVKMAGPVKGEWKAAGGLVGRPASLDSKVCRTHPAFTPIILTRTISCPAFCRTASLCLWVLAPWTGSTAGIPAQSGSTGR